MYEFGPSTKPSYGFKTSSLHVYAGERGGGRGEGLGGGDGEDARLGGGGTRKTG